MLEAGRGEARPVRLRGQAVARGRRGPVGGRLRLRREGRRLSPSDDLAVVGRRGAALFLYTANARGRGAKKEITGQAGKMAKKVCGLPGVCGKKTGSH
ncbi:hypothetical protein ACFSTC_03975 [Nonomuraea ferruginea]